MEGSLQGQVALVTGASRGIGKAVALALAAEGAKVVLMARSQAALAQVRQEISSKGGEAHVFVGDVSQPEAAQGAVVEAVQCYGGLDILVNCAGIGVFAPLVETDPADWDRVMAVNARGPFLMCRAAVPVMAERGQGCIVNIASVVGVKGYVNQGAYTASKHALMGMTKVLAQEVQPLGIRVHVVCPGGVDTDLVAQARPDLDRSVLMQPEEIAEIVLFLIRQKGRAIIDQVNVRRRSSAPWFS